MCGGMVELKSSVPNQMIGDSKPLYWKDLLDAPIKGCPSLVPCTKVVSITDIGTEENVADSNSSFLLRTDGFKSDQGKGILLEDPGQSSTSTLPKPSAEKVFVELEELKEKEEELKEDKKENISTYKIKLLRKSNDIYKPLRPIRDLKLFEELSITDKKDTYLLENIYSFYLSYLYIYDEVSYKEVKISSQSTLYHEKIDEVFFIYDGEKLNYIPLEEDKKITIYYSNIKLDSPKEEDLKDLHNITIDTTNLDEKSSFFVVENHGLNKSIISEDDLKFIKKKEKDEESKEHYIVGIFDDILGEIEDLYNNYHDSFKKAYRNNYDNINQIKEINSYPFTISSMIDKFYVDEDTNKAFKELNEYFKDIVDIFLSDEKYLNTFFLKNKGDISWIFDRDKHNIGLSYLNMIKNRYYPFFEEFSYSTALKKDVFKRNSNKDNFNIFFEGKGFKYIEKIQFKVNNFNFKNSIYFTPKSKDYEAILKNANEFLATIIFSIIFSSDEEFEAIIKSSNSASKLEANRVEFDKILKNIRPITFINTKKDEELKKFIEKDTIYSQILNRDSKNSSDSYLNDYENLDLLNTKQSFIQDGKTFDSFIKSKYLYFKNSSFYKNISKDEDTPEEIIKVIHNKLKSEELKNILEAYKNIKNTNLQEYILFSKNTLYMLCAPRLNIDEESIFNNIFHKDLSNIFKFYTSMRVKMKGIDENKKEDSNKELKKEEKGKGLADDAIADLIVQYRISALFFNMISKSYTFAILQPKESDFHKNAMTFIPYEEKTEEEKKDFKLRFHFINEPKFTKQILEKVKEVELISKAVEDILDEIIKNEDNLKYKDSVDKYLKSLRTFSSTIAFLRIIDFTLMDDKSFKDFSQFANDVLSLTIYVTNFLKQKNILNKNTLAIFTKELQKDRKMLFTNLSTTNRFNIIFIIINSIIDSKKLYENDDYDALVTHNLLSILVITTMIFPASTPIKILYIFLEIVISSVVNHLIESDLVVFLKRTILAKNISTSNVLFNDNKVYTAHFLANSFKNNKDVDVGFKSDKALINFIGENYFSYKDNFELAFKNELQFLYTNLIGLKLEKIKYISEKSKNEFIIDSRKVYLDIKEAILIPNTLIEDEKFVLTFDGTNYSKDDLTNNNIFNPFKDDTIISSFVFRNIFKYSSNLSIITSSVELNYSITYNIKKDADFSSTKIYIDINKIEQIEFDK
ncbi:putative membrane protein [Aliarcobacter skirrowii CCUG 10374]|nr:putative membrane protein [Aliarcobacter skirrowii CCUG 10374]